MQLTFFDMDLEQTGILYTWVSLVWREEYYKSGTFQLEVQRTAGSEAILKPWTYCLLSGRDCPMLILSVQITENTIVANGESALYVLSRRISTTSIEYGNAEELMRRIVSEITPWPALELGELLNLPTEVEKRVNSGTAYDRLNKLGEAADVGFRIRKSGKKLLFEVYQPGNNPNIKYSDMYGNVGGIKYTVNQRNAANVAIVEGQAKSDGRYRVIVGNDEATGADRLELYVDAKDLQKESDESDAKYLQRLEDRGQSKLDEAKTPDALEFTPYDDGANVGDLINIVIKSLGLRFAVRVLSLEIVHQRNTIKRTIKVSEPKQQ